MSAWVNDRSQGISLVVLSSACWALSGYFIKFVVAGSNISAWSLAFWRELLTAVVLYTGINLKGKEYFQVAWKDLFWLAGMGALGMGLLHVTWNFSVMLNGMAVATVFQYNAPFFVAIAAWFLWREPLTWRKGSAVVLAFVGTVLVARFDWQIGSELTWVGLLTGMGTAVAFSILSLFGKKLSVAYEPWTILFYTFGFGALALLPFQLGNPLPNSFPAQSLLAFVGLILISTIAGYVFYTAGLKRLQSSIAVIVATMEVPIAAVVALLAFNDRLGTWQVVGAICVILGITLLSVPQKKQVTAVNQQRADGI